MTEDSQQLNETAVPAASDEAAPDTPPAMPAVVRDGPGGWALMVAVLLNWAAILAVTFLVLHLSGGTIEQAGEMSSLNVLVISLLSTLITFSIVWYFACRRYGKSLRDGLLLKGAERKTLKKWAYISIFAGCMAAAALALAGEEEGFLLDLVKQPGGLAALILMAILLPPFEEAYYRGLIQPVLTRKIGAVAVPLTALWFTSAHLAQLWGNWPGVAVIATMALLWSLLRRRYNSLLPSIVSHWCYNTTLVVITVGQVLVASIGGA
ncbi:MAG TPA: type II CAAX endopeptidase family protein [Candidatus Bathyarchaeia archaeon]|nr:type II CAAX endopeptidase family protein [Candidatus Bathyarchaeia archaeon]